MGDRLHVFIDRAAIISSADVVYFRAGFYRYVMVAIDGLRGLLCARQLLGVNFLDGCVPKFFRAFLRLP